MIRVAAAQIRISHDADENFHSILDYIKDASRKNVTIVCFPEKALISTTNKDLIKAISVKKYIDEIKQHCKKYRIYSIVPSYIVKSNSVYNVAFIIDDSGKLLYTYYKNKKFRSERKIKTKRTNKIIKTKFGKIAVIICWDITYPDYFKQLARKGAWIIFCPSYTKNHGRELESYLQIPYVRAFETSSYVVMADSANRECAQYSVVCSPSNKKELKRKEGLLIEALDKRKIVGLRKYYGLL